MRRRKEVPSTFQRFSLFDNNGLTEGAIRRGLVRGRINLLLKMAANVGDERFRFTIFLSYRGRWKAESFTKVHRVSRPCYASFDENWKGAPQDPFLSWKTRSFLFIFLVSFLLEFLKRSVWNQRGYDGFWRLKNTGLSIPVLKSNIFRFRSVSSI